MKNTGKPYEALTEQVFTRLLAQSKVCAKVERDVVLTGKSTKHQIDVTFEFVAGPMTYRTIVQCKDWATAVKQEQVLAFQSVLSDIPGQPRGIIVSRSGFQEGARNVAEHHGIKLYELREPRDEDWDGLIRYFVVNMHLRAPNFDDVRLLPDEVAIRQELLARGLPSIDLNFGGHPSELPIVFASGEPCDLNRILNRLVPKSGTDPIQIRHRFCRASVHGDPRLPDSQTSPSGYRGDHPNHRAPAPDASEHRPPDRVLVSRCSRWLRTVPRCSWGPCSRTG